MALVACLNIGVDPPDSLTHHTRCRLQCWVDPASRNENKALAAIGRNLERQYKRWHPRAKYMTVLDPTVRDMSQLLLSLRHEAGKERILFHYNGHGVPMPTEDGLIYVFNPSYTEYHTIPTKTIAAWLGAPAIYVLDCGRAGL